MKVDSERLGGRDMGRRKGRLTGDRSAGWGHLLPPIIRSSAGDGSVWWHTLIFHFHFYSTCCLGVQHRNGDRRMKEEDSHTHCFHHHHRRYCSTVLLLCVLYLSLVCRVLPDSEIVILVTFTVAAFVLFFETTPLFSNANAGIVVDIFKSRQ